MKQSLIDLINVHTTMDSFYKKMCADEKMSKDCLPEEYRGMNSSIGELKEEVQKDLLGNLDFFEEEGKLLVDESKRVGKSTIMEELFDVGVQGSFKKLEVD